MSENKNQPGFNYASRAATGICLETPSDHNPFVAERRFIHGYDVVELAQKKSFIESLLMMFLGEFPSRDQARLFECLMVGLMNLGPRDPATRAAMVAGVSKTNAEHLLPVGLLVLGGSDQGATEVYNSYRFFEDNIERDPKRIAQALKLQRDDSAKSTPGFGCTFASCDPIMQRLQISLAAIAPQATVFDWSNRLLAEFDNTIGWLAPGLAAAVFYEIGLGARESVGLFQLVRAPGIVAQAMEQTHKPITAMPMLADEYYHYEK